MGWDERIGVLGLLGLGLFGLPHQVVVVCCSLVWSVVMVWNWFCLRCWLFLAKCVGELCESFPAETRLTVYRRPQVRYHCVKH